MTPSGQIWHTAHCIQHHASVRLSLLFTPTYDFFISHDVVILFATFVALDLLLISPPLFTGLCGACKSVRVKHTPRNMAGLLKHLFPSHFVCLLAGPGLEPHKQLVEALLHDTPRYPPVRRCKAVCVCVRM